MDSYNNGADDCNKNVSRSAVKVPTLKLKNLLFYGILTASRKKLFYEIINVISYSFLFSELLNLQLMMPRIYRVSVLWFCFANGRQQMNCFATIQ